MPDGHSQKIAVLEKKETPPKKILLLLDLNNIFYSLRTVVGENTRINYAAFINFVKNIPEDSVIPVVYLKTYTNNPYAPIQYSRIGAALTQAGFIIRLAGPSSPSTAATATDLLIMEDLQTMTQQVDQVYLASGNGKLSPVCKTLLSAQPHLDLFIVTFKHTISKTLQNLNVSILYLDDFLDTNLLYTFPTV